MATKTKKLIPTVVCVKKAELQKRGYNDFEDWNSKSNTLYIGRNMSYYVPGATQSIWRNKFTVKKHGLRECLIKYGDYLLKNKELLSRLSELYGKELGCWCVGDKSKKIPYCHGHILQTLVKFRLAGKV